MAFVVALGGGTVARSAQIPDWLTVALTCAVIAAVGAAAGWLRTHLDVGPVRVLHDWSFALYVSGDLPHGAAHPRQSRRTQRVRRVAHRGGPRAGRRRPDGLARAARVSRRYRDPADRVRGVLRAAPGRSGRELYTGGRPIGASASGRSSARAAASWPTPATSSCRRSARGSPCGMNIEATARELPGLWLTPALRARIDAASMVPVGAAAGEALRLAPRGAFPAASALVTLLAMAWAWRYGMRVRWLVTVAGALAIVAAVYLRYHYAVDVARGRDAGGRRRRGGRQPSTAGSPGISGRSTPTGRSEAGRVSARPPDGRRLGPSTHRFGRVPRARAAARAAASNPSTCVALPEADDGAGDGRVAERPGDRHRARGARRGARRCAAAPRPVPDCARASVPGSLRVLRAPVVGGQRRGALARHRAGQEAGRHRRIDDDADVVCAGSRAGSRARWRGESSSTAAAGCAIGAMAAHALHLGDVEVRHADVPELARLLQVGQRAASLPRCRPPLSKSERLGPVELVEIDGVGLPGAAGCRPLPCGASGLQRVAMICPASSQTSEHLVNTYGRRLDPSSFRARATTSLGAAEAVDGAPCRSS